jgi:hypothetical protein
MSPTLPRAFRFLQRAVEVLSRPFILSLASVTAFRLLLGFAVLYDLLRWRLPWFAVWYTDGGLFRGDEVYRLTPPVLPFFFGHPLLSYLLFALLVLAALLFGLGYRPQVMALLAGVLLLALDARNPWLLNTGHALMPAFLLLSVLLPLEGSWGIGAALFRGPVPEAVRTPVLLPFLLLAFTAYFLNAVAKDFEVYFARADATSRSTSPGRTRWRTPPSATAPSSGCCSRSGFPGPYPGFPATPGWWKREPPSSSSSFPSGP